MYSLASICSIAKIRLILRLALISALLAAHSAEGFTIVGTSPMLNNGFYDTYMLVACDTADINILSANAACAGFGQGWTLASINTASTNSFVASTVSSENVVLAGSDAANEGTWVWQAGRMKGQVFYTAGACVSGYYCNWEDGQPDNLHGIQDELVLWKSTSSPLRRWDDTAGKCFACERSRCHRDLDCTKGNTLSFNSSRYFEEGSSCGCVCKPGFGGDRCQLVLTTTTLKPTTTPNPTTTTTQNPTTTTPNPTTTTQNPTTTTQNPTTTTTQNPTTTTPNPTTTTQNPTTTTQNPTTTTPHPTTMPNTPNPTNTPNPSTSTPNLTTTTTTPLDCTSSAFSSLLIDTSGTSANGGFVHFPLSTFYLDGSGIAMWPVWNRLDGAGDAGLTAAFLAVADDVRCSLAGAAIHCMIPDLHLPTDRVMATASFTAAVTVPPPLGITACNVSVLVLHLTVFAAGYESSTIAMAAVERVIVGVGAGVSAGFALLVEPWALEPLVFVGVLDGPCAPVAARSAARIAVYILNPFAAVGPSGAGPLLILLVALAALIECGVKCVRAVRRRLPQPAVLSRRAVDLLTMDLLRQCVPALAFKSAVVSVPGVAWAAAGIIQREAAMPAGAHAASLCLCLFYLLAVPAIAATVIFRAAPARFESVPPRLWRSASPLVRWVYPNGRWFALTSGPDTDEANTFSVAEAVAAAVGSVRGIAAGRRGQLLCTTSTLLSTFVFSLTVAPPASRGCGGRHYATAVVLAALVVAVAALRPFNTRAANALTGLVLLLVAVATIAVGAGTSAGGTAAIAFSVMAVVASVVRSVHGLWLLRHLTAVNASDPADLCIDTPDLNEHIL